jgi:hypothetical protein
VRSVNLAVPIRADTPEISATSVLHAYPDCCVAMRTCRPQAACSCRFGVAVAARRFGTARRYVRLLQLTEPPSAGPTPAAERRPDEWRAALQGLLPRGVESQQRLTGPTQNVRHYCRALINAVADGTGSAGRSQQLIWRLTAVWLHARACQAGLASRTPPVEGSAAGCAPCPPR